MQSYILISRFRNLNTLHSLFVSDYFLNVENRVSSIGYQINILDRQYVELVNELPVVVYILIRVEAGKVWDVAQAIGKISGVDRSNVVTGPYDVIAYAVLPSTEDLRKLMEGIHSVDGVNRTVTCIAI